MQRDNDFELEEMENSAVNNSNKYKRAAAVGGIGLGLGITGAMAADKMTADDVVADSDALDSESLLAGAEAGAIDETVTEQEDAEVAEQAAEPQEVHVYHHVEVSESAAAPEPEISIDESTVIYDEAGNQVAAVDKGTYNGRDFFVLDDDGDGYGDQMAFDANGNKQIDEGEVIDLDSGSYVMGQGKEHTAYVVGSDDVNPGVGNDPIADIHNDFVDEKTGEVYSDDLAENNPDYSNDEGDQYYAGIENDFRAEDSLADEKYGDEMGESDYDYTPEEDMAYNEDTSFDGDRCETYEDTTDFSLA